MKHTLKITIILLIIFLASQIVGLYTISKYFKPTPEGTIVYEDLPMDIQRPEVEEKNSWIFIMTAVIIGTVLLLFLIKIGSKYITKIWFLAAIFISLMIAFAAYLSQLNAAALALTLALWRIFYPNVYVHNFTEIFMYGGITALFHQMLSVKFTIILLILISIYDMIAVWKIKHMVTLANYQAKEKMFAGAFIEYSAKPSLTSSKTVRKHKPSAEPSKVAILGGGDMAFPLFFASAVLKEYSFLYAMIPVITSTIALAILFFKTEKGKFYPAMPFITIGCLVGWAIVYFI